VKTYVLNLLLAIDRLLNAIMLGDSRETVSSRIGRIKLANGGNVPKKRPLLFVIDSMLETIDDNHSIDAIEPGGGAGGVMDDK
jgi:hypothetical protein